MEAVPSNVYLQIHTLEGNSKKQKQTNKNEKRKINIYIY